MPRQLLPKPKPRAKGTWKKCERCDGAGARIIIVGPHINELGAVPGGPAAYDCRACKARGWVRVKDV